MAERERVDLQREADEERPGLTKSEDAWRRLESFKHGEVDRWGREASIGTPIEDFYRDTDSSRSPEGGRHGA